MFRKVFAHKSNHNTQTNSTCADIDLSPLLNAARVCEYDKLRELSRGEYSLFWYDHRTYETALMTLAKEGHNEAVMLLLAEQTKRYHVEPEDCLESLYFHHMKFLLSEALEGASWGNNEALLTLLRETYLKSSNDTDIDRRTRLMASIDRGNKAVIDLQNLTALRKYILLRLGKCSQLNTAQDLLLLDCKQVKLSVDSPDRNEFFSRVTELILGIAMNHTLPFEKTVNGLLKKLKISKDMQRDHALVIGSAAAGGHMAYVLARLDNLQQDENTKPFVDNIKQAIKSAARYGHITLVLALCDRLKSSTVAPAEYFKIVLLAASAAMSGHHFGLMRKLMDKVPATCVNAFLPDLGWQREQIIELFRQVRDPLICHQIAISQAGIEDEQGSDLIQPKEFWLNLLKEEYNLANMSDEGFALVVNHPEMVYLLARCFYKRFENDDSYFTNMPIDLLPYIALMTVDNQLSTEDKRILIQSMNDCITVNKVPQQKNLQRLMTHIQVPKDSRESIECFRAIKKDILAILDPSKFTLLRQRINVSGSVAKLYAELNESLHYAKDKNRDQIMKCLKVFGEDNYATLPVVIRAIEKYKSSGLEKGKLGAK